MAALDLYRKEVEANGDSRGLYNVGRMYEIGLGVKKSDEEAAKWYRRAAEQGSVGAQHKMGFMYLHGNGVEQSDEAAAKWFRRVADQGDADAQFILGSFYSDGRGVEQSDEEAVEWYRKAAEQGDPSAQFKLGWAYEEGWGVEQSGEEAVRWYKLAAEQGDLDSQLSLGSLYEQGDVVEQSGEEAVKWYRKAADQGDYLAQAALGHIYGYGVGVEKDLKEAKKWYGILASKGDCNAVANLGCLAYMEGSEQSYEEARRLFEKASDMGSFISKVFLASMCIDGLAGEASKEKALELLSGVSDDEDEDVQRVIALVKSGDWNGCSLEIKKLIFSPVEYVPPELLPPNRMRNVIRRIAMNRHGGRVRRFGKDDQGRGGRQGDRVPALFRRLQDRRAPRRRRGNGRAPGEVRDGLGGVRGRGRGVRSRRRP